MVNQADAVYRTAKGKVSMKQISEEELMEIFEPLEQDEQGRYTFHEVQKAIIEVWLDLGLCAALDPVVLASTSVLPYLSPRPRGSSSFSCRKPTAPLYSPCLRLSVILSELSVLP